jgi:hypothetical protein
MTVSRSITASSLVSLVLLATPLATATAYAQGQSQYAPGQQQTSPGTAKEYAPGQMKQPGESASQYAPGHQGENVNNNKKTGRSSTESQLPPKR